MSPTSDASDASESTIATKTAALLLETGAVAARIDPLFELTSGRKSPVYVDCRRLISFVRERRAVMDFAVTVVARRIGLETLDVIAGGETAGIPYAAWLADRLSLPMVYVRKTPKSFGRNAAIEGVLPDGARVLLVEDLCTDGGSKIAFCDSLRRAGARVTDCLVVFNYDLFPHADERLAGAGVRVHALTTWRDVWRLAKERAAFPPETLDFVESYLALARRETPPPARPERSPGGVRS